MSDYYQQRINGGAVFGGAVLLQASGEIGGQRYVFVKLVGNGKNELCYPTFGGVLQNPFPGPAKIFAGDLVEYDPGLDEANSGAKVTVMKTYELAAAASTTTIKLVRDGFHHVPFVGDNIMVAPDELDGTGTAVTITSVEATTDATAGDVWQVKVSASLTGAKGDVLVEAAKAGSGVTAMVTNPNCYAQSDYDLPYYNNASGATGYEKPRYMFTPCLATPDTVLYIDRMGPLPPAVKALNKSRVNGWFHL